MSSDLLGLFAILAFTFLLGSLVAASKLPRELTLLFCAGLLLRVLGAVARHFVIFRLYNGSGDAVTYFEYGERYAEQFRAFDFSPLWDSAQWRGSTWWGTQFMNYPTGFVVALLGSTMIGSFVAFALMAYGGLVAFVQAFRNAYPDADPAPYARWVWLFPSLWFWPSSIGKESITLLGFGLAVYGFIGRNGRMKLVPLLAGLAVVFAIRPQVAAVIILAFVTATWLRTITRWTFGSTIQSVVILGVGLAAIYYSLGTVGVGSFDAEGVQTYMTDDPSRRVGGGSAIETGPVGLAGIPMALVNVLFRPFPWEVRGVLQLFSSLEMVAFWLLAIVKRRRLLHALRHWRADPMVRVALPLILVYATSLGMMLGNIGIIARQRIFLFPFLFLLLEAAPKAVAPDDELERELEPDVEPETPFAGRPASLGFRSRVTS
jgi:hypothetical protein